MEQAIERLEPTTPERPMDTKRYLEKAKAIAAALRSIFVSDQATHDLGADQLTKAAAYVSDVQSLFGPLKKKAFDAHRALCDAESQIIKDVRHEITALGGRIAAWEIEQRRLDDQRRAQEAEDNRRKEEKQRKEAEKEALSYGATPEAAKAIAEDVPSLPPPPTQPSFQTARGVTVTETWKWRVAGKETVALKKLVRAAAKDDRLLQYLTFNGSTLTDAAKHQKSAARIPGILIEKVAGTRVRRS